MFRKWENLTNQLTRIWSGAKETELYNLIKEKDVNLKKHDSMFETKYIEAIKRYYCDLVEENLFDEEPFNTTCFIFLLGNIIKLFARYYKDARRKIYNMLEKDEKIRMNFGSFSEMLHEIETELCENELSFEESEEKSVKYSLDLSTFLYSFDYSKLNIELDEDNDDEEEELL